MEEEEREEDTRLRVRTATPATPGGTTPAPSVPAPAPPTASTPHLAPQANLGVVNRLRFQHLADDAQE